MYIEDQYLVLKKLKTIILNYIYGLNKTKDVYAEFAARELWKYCCENKDKSVIFSIERFIEKMNHWSTLNGDYSYCFSVAYDTATYIYDCLLAVF